MKLLSTLIPAETMLILDSSCTLKDMMKFTFMDLLLKRVIEIKVEKNRVVQRDKYAKKVEVIKSYTYVLKGKNFDKYKPKRHELVFLRPFQKDSSIKILFKHFVKMAYENTGGKGFFKSDVLSSKNLDAYIKVSFLQQIFGGMSLTPKGIQAKDEIRKYLTSIDENIEKLLNEDKKKALEILMALGGNIYLLKNLDFAQLKKIDKQLLKAQKSKYTEHYDAGGDWWFYLDFYDDSHAFDSYFDDFDSTIVSFETDYDAAGCFSGNSGCSSCSGCGGCGGCGGCS